MRLMIRQEAWRVFLLLQFFFLLLLTNVIRLRVCALLSSAACETPPNRCSELVPEHQFLVVKFPGSSVSVVLRSESDAKATTPTAAPPQAAG